MLKRIREWTERGAGGRGKKGRGGKFAYQGVIKGVEWRLG